PTGSRSPSHRPSRRRQPPAGTGRPAPARSPPAPPPTAETWGRPGSALLPGPRLLPFHAPVQLSRMRTRFPDYGPTVNLFTQAALAPPASADTWPARRPRSPTQRSSCNRPGHPPARRPAMSRALGPGPAAAPGGAQAGWTVLIACWSMVALDGLVWAAARLAAALTGGRTAPFGTRFAVDVLNGRISQ